MRAVVLLAILVTLGATSSIFLEVKPLPELPENFLDGANADAWRKFNNHRAVRLQGHFPLPFWERDFDKENVNAKPNDLPSESSRDPQFVRFSRQNPNTSFFIPEEWFKFWRKSDGGTGGSKLLKKDSQVSDSKLGDSSVPFWAARG